MIDVLKNNYSKVFSIFITALCGFFIYYLYKRGIIFDSESMARFLSDFGIFAPIAFVVLYVLSVVFPLIPGAMLNILGVLLFGPLMGFVYNYVGSIIGSFGAYFISKKYGINFVVRIVGKEKYRKQNRWLQTKHRFDIVFALMILLPGFPDDVMCYIAGITGMGYKKFILILSLLKVPGIVLYSFGVSSFFDLLSLFSA